jgi:predicted glycosyltransferase
MTPRPALLFYCQHSVGLGHLTRSYALCAGLAQRFRVVLVCGGAVPAAIRPPNGVEIVALPPLGVGPDGRFVSQDPQFAVEEAWAARKQRIIAVYRALRPRVVLVELFPFGRAKFARELVPLLEAAREDGALAACSLRDILVSRRADQQAHDDRAQALADAYLDTVLVHSDPAFARLEETFAPQAPLRVPVRYTGFVVREATGPSALGPTPSVIVSAGGGRVGERLLQTAAAAQRTLWPATGATMRLIAGPLVPGDAWERLQAAVAGQPGIDLVRSVPDLAAELRGASASVSQAGYNTVLEVVRSRVPALAVPYATPEEDEQLRRARRLERLGALRVLDPDRLDPGSLALEIERLSSFEPRPAAVDLGGVSATCRILDELVRPEVAA